MSYKSNSLLHQILDQPVLVKPPIIVYHQAKSGVDCPDGICAAWVVAKALQERGCTDFELIGDTYLNEKDYEQPEYALPFDPADRQVIIVDFSYPQHILQHIVAFADEVIVLDHHKSRGEFLLQMSLENIIKGGFNEQECGATYAWQYFFPNTEQPWFLAYVRQRDIGADGYYQGLIPESEAIGEAMSARRRGKIGIDAFSLFDELLNVSASDLIAEGMPKIAERNCLIESYLSEWNDNSQYTDVLGFTVPYFELPRNLHRYYSMVGAIGAVRYHEYPFVVVVTDDPKNFSLRSRLDGADVSEIAKKLGGGGHKHAAGFSI